MSLEGKKQEHFTSYADIAAYRNQGLRHNGKPEYCFCPIHQGSSKSLKIFHNGYFYCFSCGAEGFVDEVRNDYLKPVSKVEQVQKKRLAEATKRATQARTRSLDILSKISSAIETIVRVEKDKLHSLRSVDEFLTMKESTAFILDKEPEINIFIDESNQLVFERKPSLDRDSQHYLGHIIQLGLRYLGQYNHIVKQEQKSS